MLDNDWEIFVMGTEFRPGQMERGMKANERTTKRMESENFGMSMEMFTKANEGMIKLTAKVFIGRLTELVMKENEKMIYKKDMAKKLGLMEVNMKGITAAAKSMGMGVIIEKTGRGILASGLITKSLVMGLIIDMMEENMKASERLESWTDLGLICEKMAEGMKGIIKMIKNTDMGLIFGRMEGAILEDGKMEISMDLAR